MKQTASVTKITPQTELGGFVTFESFVHSLKYTLISKVLSRALLPGRTPEGSNDFAVLTFHHASSPISENCNNTIL